MIYEEKLSIRELMNYGINYGDSVPININELRQLFDHKEGRKNFQQNIDMIEKELIEEYKIPRSIARTYMKLGKIFSFESGSKEKTFYLDYYELMKCVLAYFMNEKEAKEISNCMFGLSIDEMKEMVNKKLKKIRTELSHIKNQEEMVQFINCYPIVYQETLQEMLFQKKTGSVGEQISKKITDIIVNNKYLAEYMQKCSVNHEIFKGINKEKFLLYLAASTLHTSSFYEDINPAVYYAINYYLHKSEDEIPDIKIKVGNNTYTFLTFSKRLKDYLKKHPNVGMTKFKLDTFKGCSPEEVKGYLEEFQKETLKNFDIVETDDVYIPNGVDTGVTRGKSIGERGKRKPQEISKLTLQKRKFYNENKEQIYVTLMGKNKFDGYLAHVFKNGYVVFEKHDRSSNAISNQSGAAYIMTIHNFNEFSKKSIPEIRDYVKQNPGGDVDYLCHSGAWMKKLQSIIDRKTNISLPEIERVLLKCKATK